MLSFDLPLHLALGLAIVAVAADTSAADGHSSGMQLGSSAKVVGEWVGTQTCLQAPAGCQKENPERQQRLTILADGGGEFQGEPARNSDSWPSSLDHVPLRVFL